MCTSICFITIIHSQSVLPSALHRNSHSSYFLILEKRELSPFSNHLPHSSTSIDVNKTDKRSDRSQINHCASMKVNTRNKNVNETMHVSFTQLSQNLSTRNNGKANYLFLQNKSPLLDAVERKNAQPQQQDRFHHCQQHRVYSGI